ncbi:hypothetical protein J6590_107120, partial [Homalodisca vitripennis]
MKNFGEIDVQEYVPGAEVLLEENKAEEQDSDESDSDSDNESWVDISHSEDEISSVVEKDKDMNQTDEIDGKDTDLSKEK